MKKYERHEYIHPEVLPSLVVQVRHAFRFHQIPWGNEIVDFGIRTDYRPEHSVVSDVIILNGNHPEFRSNPTYGQFSEGSGEITIDHEERITCLDGLLNLDIGDGFKHYKADETAIIPAGTTFKYDHKQPVLYVCEYR